MVRRALAAVGFAALALAGAASAGLVDPGGAPGSGPGATGTTSLSGLTGAAASGSTPTTVSTPGTTTATAGTTGTTGATTGPATATTTTAAVPVTGTATASSAAAVIVVTGHGFGHGMGMGQWGAYGYALHGWSDAQILGHYYPGTTLGHDPSRPVRVLLAQDVTSVTVASAAPWHLRDGAGARLRLPAGALVVPASLRLKGRKLVSPLTFRPGRAPVEAGARAYRGSLVVHSSGTTLDLVNTLPLESYVEGVVADEMPPGWPEAALEAQAIASRSFALAQIGRAAVGRSFDVYDDGRNQVYGGIAAETPTVDQAVAATAGQVVLYQGQVADTLFSSSSGGETASAADVTGIAVPYLVAVPDPYDALSPDHDWGPLLLSPAGAGHALGLGGPLQSVELSPGAGHVASVTAASADRQVTLTGQQVQADLGLRSTFFQVGMVGQ